MSAAVDIADIIPRPVEAERRPGVFVFSADTAVVADAASIGNVRVVQDLLGPPTGFPLPLQRGEARPAGAVHLSCARNADGLGREGYLLTIAPDEVHVTAPEPAGVFYGLQTLRQLLPVEVERCSHVPGVRWELPCGLIRDAPRFAWRGYMLDEGRHFQGRETVLRALDHMALQKLNVLHWHLTEDQGWRMEIRRFPRLTELGSWRRGTARHFIGRCDTVAHGGFYTQAEIREIVAYAASRHITIVPEIEMPGHSLAALAAYPELSCTGGPFEVACRFGVLPDILCAGKESVFTFLQNVLDEVLDVFPAPFVHIGGDEAPKRRWKRCPDCQQRIRQEGLADEDALQVYLTNRIASYLAARARRAVGWNEILHEGLAEGAVVQYWLGKPQEVQTAIRSGRDVIMSSYWHTYLDHSYSLTPLSRAYDFDPLLPGLGEEDAGHVLGLEAPMWTEWVDSRARLDYQTYPRLTAFAETGWSPRTGKDLEGFQRRLARFLPRLDELGVGYAPLDEVEPPCLRRLFGKLTIAQPQTRTASHAV